MKIGLVYLSEASVLSGGAEHILCDMANALCQRGHQLFVFIDHPDLTVRPFYPLNPEVFLINIRHGIYRYFPKWLRAWGRKMMMLYYTVRLMPNVFICTTPNDLRMLPNGEGFAKVLMQHSPPAIYIKHQTKKRRYRSIRRALKKTAFIQVLNPSFKVLTEFIYRTQTPIEIIPNPVPVVPDPIPLQRPQHKTILCVGRLAPEKRPDMLLKIWPTIHQKHPDWKLEFYGAETDSKYTRECRAILPNPEAQNVFFKGVVSDMMARYRTGDFIVVPSRFESWCLAMTEAMSVGLPAIGFNTTSGVAELIQSGQNGLLCDETEPALTEGILWMIEHPEARARMGVKAHEMMAPFAPERIWDLWEEKLAKAALSRADIRL